MEECITGINKTNFEKWYIESYVRKKENIGLHVFGTKIFERTPIGYKKGVFEDYFDSLGIILDTQPCSCCTPNKWFANIIYNGNLICGDEFNTRIEAFKEVLKKANELINQQLNNK